MRGIHFLCILVISGVLPLEAGVLSDFGPFPDSETVSRVPLKPCTMLRSTRVETRTVEEFAMPEEAETPFLTVTVDNPIPGKWTSTLRMDFGKRLPSYEGVIEGASWFMEVLTADLNGDGKPDYVIPYVLNREEVPQEDVPGDLECVLFALSGPKVHRFTNVTGIRFDEDGFISLLNDGAVQWVHTLFLAKHPARSKFADRKVYFYLHRLFYVRGDQLTAVEGMDARFPRFVLYSPGTSRKNHKETKLLTAEQKKALLEANPAGMGEWLPKVTTPRPVAPKRKVRSTGRGGK